MQTSINEKTAIESLPTVMAVESNVNLIDQSSASFDCDSLEFYDQTFQFVPYTATLTQDSKQRLQLIAKQQIAYNDLGLRYEIKGYAEQVDKPAMSLTLSEKRAITVKEYLIKQGVSVRTLIYQGYGELIDNEFDYGVKITVLNAPECY